MRSYQCVRLMALVAALSVAAFSAGIGQAAIQTEVIHAVPGGGVSIAVDSQNRPHIAYFQSFPDTDRTHRLWYARFNGRQWHRESLTTIGIPAGTAIAIDRKDRPHICYVDVRKQMSHLIHTVLDQGDWRYTTAVSEQNFEDLEPKIYITKGALDFYHYRDIFGVDHDFAAIAYGLYHPMDVKIYLVRQMLDYSWRTPLLLADSGLLPYPHFIYDISGSLTIADNHTSARVLYSQLEAITLKRQPMLIVENLGTAGFDQVLLAEEGYGESQAFDSANKLHLCYQKSDQNGFVYAKYLNLGNPMAAEVENLATDTIIFRISIALDAADRPHIVFSDHGIPGHRFYYQFHDGSQWVKQSIDGDGYGYTFDLATDSNNLAHIASRANFDSLVYTAACADTDGDGYCENYNDNCPDVDNPSQEDADGDGIGDACDNCPLKASTNQVDSDEDGIGDACDNCRHTANADQGDTDGDGAGDACDNCTDTPNGPRLGTCTGDRDQTCNFAATTPCKINCENERTFCEIGCMVDDPFDFWWTCAPECRSQFEACAVACECGGGWCDTSQSDCNTNGIGNACDPIPCTPVNLRIVDIDDTIDQGETLEYPHLIPCPAGSCFGQLITLSWAGSEMELSLVKPDGTLLKRVSSTKPIDISIPNDPTTDGTWSMVVKAIDVPNDGYDFNLYGANMSCPHDPSMDIDRDGVCGDVDNCPDDYNTGQSDIDGDGIGDACDNCPEVANPTQFDGNANGTGDACEPVAVPMDVYLGMDPNVLVTSDTLPLTVVVAGGPDLDVEKIDPQTLTIAGVAPLKKSGYNVADVTCPYCVGSGIVPDGFQDLMVRFSGQSILSVLESISSPLETGQRFSLRLNGSFEAGHLPRELTAMDAVEIWAGHRCVGDFEPADGMVDGLDLQRFSAAFAAASLDADLDNSGTVDISDLVILVPYFGLTDCLIE